MLEQTVTPILNILREHPAGVTANVVADRLKMRPGLASTRLSRLALYGVIARKPEPGRTCNLFRYHLKDTHV